MMNRHWLDQVDETILEPELEIVDPHHHLWNTETGFGRYELEDLRTDTGSGHNVTQTVFIDCGSCYRSDGPDELRPVGETEYVASVATESEATPGARIAAIIGHADLTLGPQVESVLGAHVAASRGLFRGIRHSGARADDVAVPTSRSLPPSDLYTKPAFRDGAATLAAMGLSFEAWQYHHQLAEVTALATAIPELSIVVNHLGGPLGVGRFAGRREAVMADLQRGLEPLAELDNVTMKLGGIGMTRYGTGWERRVTPPGSDVVAELWGDLIRWTIDLFGADRCMFESNYPVDGETVSYPVLWNAFKKISANYTADDRAGLFSGTARRVYRLTDAEDTTG